MTYRWFVVARILHVLAIVVWIGGIAAITTIVFPAMRRVDSNEQKVWLFERIERSFRPQARIAWLIVGLSGLYMVWALNLWSRFTEARFWWMHAMVGLWLIFGLMLFLIEPLVVGPRLRRKFMTEPDIAVARIAAVHWVLLVLSLSVIAVVVGGIYGLF
ncbi:MAG: hypothetical protein ACREQX_08525 [Candidatus Binataceae bacterium]